MASNYWAKLWIEMLDDPKVARLDDHLWRRWVEIILVTAEQIAQDGALPSWYVTAKRLNTSEEDLGRVLDQLVKIGLLTPPPGITIPNFERFACGPDPYARAPDWELRRRAVLERDHYTCRYCRAPAIQVDHVIPRCQGGSDEFSNLVAACEHCNKSKGGRTPEQAGMELLNG